jgi:ADP-ribose pyrophosphatase YjhB (NUDIX family)
MGEFKRSSGIIVKHENKVLLCKRSPKDSYGGEWSIPAGGIEGVESPFDAAIREFKEETDIKLPKDLDLVGFINKYKKDGSTKRGMIYVYFHEADREYEPNLLRAKDGHEHTECEYFSKDELPITEKDDQLLNILKKILK